jgi:hypothetical protein
MEEKDNILVTGFTLRKLWYLPSPCLPTGEDQQAVGGVGEGSVTARQQEVRNKGMIRLGLQRQGLVLYLCPPPPHKGVMYRM